MHNHCSGVLNPETMAGAIRVYREDDSRQRVYRYQCQSCGRIKVSPKRDLKFCNEKA